MVKIIFLFFFWSTCLSSVMVFSCHFPFLKKNEEWEERYCILTRVIPFGSFFLNIYIYYCYTYLDLLPIDLGPRSIGQCYHYYYYYHYHYYYYYVEMYQRVLKTLRKMVNIKVFYKKVYNHLDIYTNTQIYIYIFIYMYISFL